MATNYKIERWRLPTSHYQYTNYSGNLIDIEDCCVKVRSGTAMVNSQLSSTTFYNTSSTTRLDNQYFLQYGNEFTSPIYDFSLDIYGGLKGTSDGGLSFVIKGGAPHAEKDLSSVTKRTYTNSSTEDSYTHYYIKRTSNTEFTIRTYSNFECGADSNTSNTSICAKAYRNKSTGIWGDFSSKDPHLSSYCTTTKITCSNGAPWKVYFEACGGGGGGGGSSGSYRSGGGGGAASVCGVIDFSAGIDGVMIVVGNRGAGGRSGSVDGCMAGQAGGHTIIAVRSETDYDGNYYYKGIRVEGGGGGGRGKNKTSGTAGSGGSYTFFAGRYEHNNTFKNIKNHVITYAISGAGYFCPDYEGSYEEVFTGYNFCVLDWDTGAAGASTSASAGSKTRLIATFLKNNTSNSTLTYSRNSANLEGGGTYGGGASSLGRGSVAGGADGGPGGGGTGRDKKASLTNPGHNGEAGYAGEVTLYIDS